MPTAAPGEWRCATVSISKELLMTFSFAAKASLLLLFLGSTLYVHLRGKARLPVLRQFVNHSALFAPYNALMYLFSGVPSKPYLDRSKFPELDVLKDNWEVIRDEAMHLFDEGYIRAAEKNNDAGFGSFFKKGWKRFYLKWYDKPCRRPNSCVRKPWSWSAAFPTSRARCSRCCRAAATSTRTATRSPVPCVITSACPRRTPTIAAFSSTVRCTPGATVKT
jgi:hypothetical protein